MNYRNTYIGLDTELESVSVNSPNVTISCNPSVHLHSHSIPPTVLMQNWSRRRSATPLYSRSKPLIPKRSKSSSPPRKQKDKTKNTEENIQIKKQQQQQYIPHLHLKKIKHKKVHKKLKENKERVKVIEEEETSKTTTQPYDNLSNSFNQFMKLQKLFYASLESDKSYIDTHRNSSTSFTQSVSTIPVENENETNQLEDLENEVMTLHMELMKKGIVK